MVSKSIGIIGNGFVGSNLLKNYPCERMTRNNYRPGKYDIVIDSSGNSSKLLPQSNPLLSFDLNVNNTLKLLLDFEFDIYIYISSCEVYDDLSSKENTKEDSIIDPSKISRYGLNKYLSECLVRNYCKNWVILRLNGPIGPNMKKGTVFDLLNTGKLWISKESEFQFIHTDFISDFIEHIIDKNITNEIFNVTGTSSISINKASDILGKEIKKCCEEVVINHNIDVDKFSKFRYITSSEEAIRKLL